ncbi:helicase HerA-like domain-containing protein [Trichlorobacter ammonificans]|uniref:ATP-binding protein n=1 Tax=Trichlorobacter ammonificans TaxID=2916410 RepID=A0ABN8HKZ3_9BACT|nr:helicase HerA-like domain-containing protein [Trichlorobacter ammonificans]CAH2031597.1 ATP-binding protein [Trichlorobacter ammonificans]
MSSPLLIAKSSATELVLLPRMANRHGLITGATGTGKTVTLQSLAEQFSTIGVPCFMSDIKGDLSGLSKPGGGNPKVEERLKLLGVAEHPYRAFPVTFWDPFGEQGHPVRATVSDMGPLLLSRMLELNETQTGVLNLVFKVADDNGLLLLDLKDLRAMLQFVGENAKTLTTDYGNVSAASVGAIQRGLLALESQGGDRILGEPMLDINDLMQTDRGLGVVNILSAEKLMGSPKLYATLLLWLLSELFENLPEAGDLDKPKLVFFFDEAHLLFNDAPPALVDKIEQVVRLIRSKGVGIYFVTQNPADIPDKVLSQLGNRVQHALRAFSPRDQKAVKAAAETMRDNPELDEAAAITELGVGEALISCLDEQGSPGVTERAFIIPPRGQIGPIESQERQRLLQGSLVAGVYDRSVDRESAYELLKARAEQATQTQAAAQPAAQGSSSAGGGLGGILGDLLGGSGSGSRQREGVVEALAKSAARSVGNQLGRAIIRGVLGSLLGNRR